MIDKQACKVIFTYANGCNIHQLRGELFPTTGDISSVQAPRNENVDSLISLYKDNDVQFEVITPLLYYSPAKNINYVVRQRPSRNDKRALSITRRALVIFIYSGVSRR